MVAHITLHHRLRVWLYSEATWHQNVLEIAGKPDRFLVCSATKQERDRRVFMIINVGAYFSEASYMTPVSEHLEGPIFFLLYIEIYLLCAFNTILVIGYSIPRCRDDHAQRFLRPK